MGGASASMTDEKSLHAIGNFTPNHTVMNAPCHGMFCNKSGERAKEFRLTKILVLRTDRVDETIFNRAADLKKGRRFYDWQQIREQLNQPFIR